MENDSTLGTPGRAHHALRFGEFVLDLDRAELFKDGLAIRLRPQSFDVLRYLVENFGRLVDKQELLNAIWGDTNVTEDSLTHCIIDIRKAIEDTDRTMIHTVPKRGFVFEVPVEPISVTASLARLALHRAPRWHALVFVAALATILLMVNEHDPFQDIAADANDHLLDTERTKAHDLYVQARFLFGRRAPGDLDVARRYFSEVIELDPGSADAWAGLAGTLEIEWYSSERNDDDLLVRSKAAAENALALNPDHIEGLLRLSRYYSAIGDRENGNRLIQRAEVLDPGDPLLLRMMAGDAARNGNVKRAIELQRRALDREPLSFTSRETLSQYLFAAGYYEMALNESRRAHQIMDSDELPIRLQGYSLILLERHEEALQLAETWPASSEKNAVIAMASFKLGHVESAITSIEWLELSPDPESFLHLAEIFAFCDHFQDSLNALAELRDYLLARATAKKKLWDLRHRIEFSPFLAPLRADERWQDWLAVEPIVLGLSTSRPPGY